MMLKVCGLLARLGPMTRVGRRGRRLPIILALAVVTAAFGIGPAQAEGDCSGDSEGGLADCTLACGEDWLDGGLVECAFDDVDSRQVALGEASGFGPAKVANYRHSYAECDGLGLGVIALNCAAAATGAYQACTTLNVPVEGNAQGSSVLLGGFSIKASAAINISACVSTAVGVSAGKIATMGGEIQQDAIASRVIVQEGGIRAFDARKSERSRFYDYCVIAPLKQASCGGTPAAWAVAGATYQCVGAVGRVYVNSDGRELSLLLPPGTRVVGASAEAYSETAACTPSSTEHTVAQIMAWVVGSNSETRSQNERGAALIDVNDLPAGLRKKVFAPIETQISAAMEEDHRNTTLLPFGDELIAGMRTNLQLAVEQVSGKVLVAWESKET